MKFPEHLDIGAGEGEDRAHARGGTRGPGAVATVSGSRAPGTQRGRRGPFLVGCGLGLGECGSSRARKASRASPAPADGTGVFSCLQTEAHAPLSAWSGASFGVRKIQ